MPTPSGWMASRAMPIALSLILLFAAVAATVIEPASLRTVRNAVFDAFQRRQPREYQPVAVRVIDVDDDSLRLKGQWPWPRSKMAELIGQLQDGGAAAIALDVLYAEPDRNSPIEALGPWRDRPEIAELLATEEDYDAVLARQIELGSVITSFVLTGGDGGRPPRVTAKFRSNGFEPTGVAVEEFLPPFDGVVASLEQLERGAAGNGAMNVIPDSDGVVRQVQLAFRQSGALEPLPSLAAEALRVYEGSDGYLVDGGATGIYGIRIGGYDITTDPRGAVWLHYSEEVPARTIPAWKVLDDQEPPGSLEGAIVFVGTSAAGLLDLRVNPLGDVTAGAEIHAQAIEQFLGGSYLVRPDWAKGAEILFLIVGGVLLMALILRYGALPAAIVGVAVTAAIWVGSWLAFANHRLLFDPMPATVSTLAIYLVCSVSNHWRTEQDKAWIRGAFSSYISPNLVEHLIDNPHTLSLGGERRECSFVFSDLESFTGLVEKLEPTSVVALLNEWLEGAVAVALEHEGTIDRIVGDSVAVMFSAPVEQPDHACRALRCALALDAFARGFKEAKAEEGVVIGRTRIGVNTGTVTIGNVGGEGLLDYRALGDPVNTAARLESVNGQLGTNVCVSGATVAACPDFIGRPIGSLVLKGKSAGVDTFEPLSKEAFDSEPVRAYLAAFELLKSESTTAVEAFAELAESAPDDPLVRFHLARLRAGENGATIVMHRK